MTLFAARGAVVGNGGLRHAHGHHLPAQMVHDALLAPQNSAAFRHDGLDASQPPVGFVWQHPAPEGGGGAGGVGGGGAWHSCLHVWRSIPAAPATHWFAVHVYLSPLGGDGGLGAWQSCWQVLRSIPSPPATH